eukprot:TRINITY_DN4329_c0_g1_i1.p1 TRINITY_DN4329_c0_g1~~TRINITY_DN4329_c0_g1_i1.p1  ORF type:complete len:126 (-),score=20.73 TRINITY_DN4329_c0_g1_i1:42-419(-)
MPLSRIDFTFRTTDQELDWDSVVDCYVWNRDGTTLVGEAHLASGHGKEWTDNTTNTLRCALKSTDVDSSVGLVGAVKMRAHGNNKWRYNLDVYFHFTDGRVAHVPFHGKELNSRGSQTVTHDLHF